MVYRLSCRAAGCGPSAVAKLFEQAAAPHAAALGVGIDVLRARGQAWMLVQLGMAARRWPEPGEAIEVVTWPSRRTAGARAWREFEIHASSGETLLEAASVWLIVDLERRRPVRLPRFLLELDFPPRETGIDFRPVPEPPGSPGHVRRRVVSPADLDANEHANNAAYLAWAEDAASGPLLPRLQVDYLEEAVAGEKITVETWALDPAAERIQQIRGRRGLLASVQWWGDRQSW